MFELKNLYPAQIEQQREFEEAIENFAYNYCKGSNRLKKDKGLALKAVKRSPFCALYLSDKLLNDKDIQDAIHEKSDYIYNKYVNPTEEYLKEDPVNGIMVGLLAQRNLIAEQLREENTQTFDEFTPIKLRGKSYDKER